MDEDIEETREQKKQEYMNNEDDEVVAHVEAESMEDISVTVENQEKVLIDFYAEWCGPCKMMEPVIEEIIEDTDITVVEVDIDNNQDIAAEFGVRGVPTYAAFKNGEQLGAVSGAREKEMLVGMFD
jgi:thioredoxin 1